MNFIIKGKHKYTSNVPGTRKEFEEKVRNGSMVEMSFNEYMQETSKIRKENEEKQIKEWGDIAENAIVDYMKNKT